MHICIKKDTKISPHLFNDHFLSSSAPLTTLYYSLEEQKELDISTLLNTVDEVLNL